MSSQEKKGACGTAVRGKLYAVLCVCGKQRHSERSPLSGAAVAVQDPTYTFLHLCQAVCKASCDMQFHLFLKFIFKCVYFCVEEGVESKYVRRARALQAPCSRVHVWLCYQVPVVCCSGGGNSPYLMQLRHWRWLELPLACRL